MERTVGRTEWLLDLFTTAMEHGGYGWFTVHSYDCDLGKARIRELESPHETFDVDITTMVKGLGVLRQSRQVVVDGEPRRVTKEGEPLGWGGQPLRELLKADRTNGDDGDYDVIGALAVLECALFGRVVYA